MSRNFFLSAWSLAMIVVAGCSPANPTGKLQGTVTFEGQPVTNATVQIQSPTTGEAAAAELDAGGKYAFDQPVPVGEYQVTIVPTYQGPVAGEETPNFKPPERKDIPERYRMISADGLKVTVSPGNSTSDFALQP